MGGFNLQELMSQAKKQYEVLQKKMQETVVEGSSGGGRSPSKMDGRKQVLSIKIDPEAVKVGRSGNAAGFDHRPPSMAQDAKWMTPCNPPWAGCWGARHRGL